MKKQFVEPDVKIIRLMNDVIRTSIVGGGEDASGFQPGPDFPLGPP